MSFKIQTVKASKSGWLVNNGIELGVDYSEWEHSRQLKEWFNNNKAEPLFTAEEKEEINKKRAEKELRASILQKGTLSQDGKMWFNFESAQMFIAGFSTLEEDDTYPWYDKDKKRVDLSYAEAKAYAREIRVALQKLYGLEL